MWKNSLFLRLYESVDQCTSPLVEHLPRVDDPCISRYEQAPGSEFHPLDEGEKIDCGFLGPSWCNKKVNPETYVSCGSYELLLNNIAHQMKEQLTIQNKFSHF